MNLIYSHICAAAENNTIGLQGELPWNIPEDLQFFKEKTLGKALIMGRKTFESLGKPLPRRLNIIITRKKKPQLKADLTTYIPIWTGGVSHGVGGRADPLMAMKKSMSVVFSSSIEGAMDFCSQEEIQKQYGKEIFIIGGGEIYKHTLPLVHRIYLTRIHRKYEGDAFYPEIPEEEFQEIDRKDREGDPSYSFITYERKKDI